MNKWPRNNNETVLKWRILRTTICYRLTGAESRGPRPIIVSRSLRRISRMIVRLNEKKKKKTRFFFSRFYQITYTRVISLIELMNSKKEIFYWSLSIGINRRVYDSVFRFDFLCVYDQRNAYVLVRIIGIPSGKCITFSVIEINLQ